MIRFKTFLRKSLRWEADTVLLIMTTTGEYFYATCQVVIKFDPEILFFDTDCLVVNPTEYHRIEYLLEEYRKEGSVYVDNDIYKSRG